MSKGVIKHYRDTDPSLWGNEVVRYFFQTDKITFGMSEVPPYMNGTVDTGHQDADEVFICAKGHVLCYFPEEDKYYEMEQYDALLIPPSMGHQIFNIGPEEAVIFFACAPKP